MQIPARGDTCHRLPQFASAGVKLKYSDPKIMRQAILLAFTIPLFAQDSLSLREAVQSALRQNKAIAGANAATKASTARVEEARAGWLPKLNYSESFVRSDNPVFVFSSLLTQHQFGAQNFNIGPLNRPDSINNFQSLLSVEQPLYDAGQTRNAVKSADLSHQVSMEEKRLTEMLVIAGVVKAYYGAMLAAESLKTAEQALRSADADLKRAESVRAAGMSTDVDVLSIRVHLAGITEERIKRAAELEVARSALNDALGLPLDARHLLTSALTRVDLPDVELASLERDASSTRPESRASHLDADLAQTQVAEVRVKVPCGVSRSKPDNDRAASTQAQRCDAGSAGGSRGPRERLRCRCTRTEGEGASGESGVAGVGYGQDQRSVAAHRNIGEGQRVG
jgi:outer membrane protein TolC